MFGAAAVEVGSDAHDDGDPAGPRCVEERVDEPVPLCGGLGRREDLLELVDDEDQAILAESLRRRAEDVAVAGEAGPLAVIEGREDAPVELPHRLGSRPDHDDRRRPPRPGSAPRLMRRHEASPDGRRLAAPGWSDDAEERRPGEASDELGDQALAAEEHVGVARLERGQALERTVLADAAAPERALEIQAEALAGRLEVDDVRGHLALEPSEVATAHSSERRRSAEAA